VYMVVRGVDCAVEDDAIFTVVDGVIVNLTCILFEGFSTTNDSVITINNIVLENDMSFAVGVDAFGAVRDGVVPHGVIVGSAFVEDFDADVAAADGVFVDTVEV